MIDAEGNFTAEFTEAVPGFLGEDHKDSKVMTDITSIGQLTKAYADNKSALGRKMDNVIQKPAEDADDTVKADYQKALRAELGIQDAAESYAFPDLQGEEGYREGSKEYWGDVFKKLNISQEQATGLTNALHEMQRANATSDSEKANEAATKQQTEDIDAFDEQYPGDTKPEALRHALAAINEFGTDALKGAVKEAKLFDNHDLKEWANHTPIQNLPFLVNVGKKAANTRMPPGEATQHAMGGPQLAALAAANKMTVDALKQYIATYPNSWKGSLRQPA